MPTKNITEYKKYRDQWEHSMKGNNTIAPTHVDIELSSACNYRCPMCPQAEEVTIFKKLFMDKKTAIGLLDEARANGVLSIKLNWRGESVIHPDFPEIVNHATSLGFQDVMLNTNGSFTDVKVMEAVNKIDTLIYSVDTLDSEVAKKIRPGGSLDVVINNVEVSALRMQISKSPKRVRVNFTKQNDNWDEEENMRKWCDEIGVEFYSKAVFPRNFPKAGVYYDKKKVKVDGRKNCGFPFSRLVVSHDGRVAPCCVPWNDDLFVGDLGKESLMDVWNGPSLERIREDAGSADYKHPTCKNCTSWASYNMVYVNGS